jgi:hypothetical protein
LVATSSSSGTDSASSGSVDSSEPLYNNYQPEMSVPSGPMIASKLSQVLHFLLEYRCIKSSFIEDSNSIVALSVSISARMSPSLILSPTLFNQVATVPSVIVSQSVVVTITTPSGKVAGAVDVVFLLLLLLV